MKQQDKPTRYATLAEAAALRRQQRADFWREAGRVAGLYVLSAVALCWVFPPYGFWPLTFVALAPWGFATCRTHRAWLVHWLSFFVGSGFFLVALRWLMPVTGPGYVALALYLAIYWTLAAWAIRTARRHGLSPIYSLPIVWVACEYLRAIVMSGFPWLFLAHGLHKQLPLIQISDLTGAYGVSFLAALVNGFLVELALRRWPGLGVKPATQRGTRALWFGAAATVILLFGTLGYGFYRLNQIDFEKDPACRGPRVAVVQADFPLVTEGHNDTADVILTTYLALAAKAAAEHPDLLVFPETPWNGYQNTSFISKREVLPEVRPDWWNWGRFCDAIVSAFVKGDYSTVNASISRLEPEPRASREAAPDPTLHLPRLPAQDGPPVTAVVGVVAVEQFPDATYPKYKLYNSALVYDPDGTQRPQRYDKNHLVPFGELVPFRYGRLHWLYRKLNALSPFSQNGRFEYSLTPGTELTVFELRTAGGTYRFGTPICYEDATPYIIRHYVWDGPRRRVDFLLNISNDGWFQHHNELPQHLAICAFRAVENRVSIARAVNTGISGFIDPNGRISSLIGPGEVGYDVRPVYLDARTSFYGRFGDWFARLCLLLTIVLWLAAVLERWVLAIAHRVEALLGKRGR